MGTNHTVTTDTSKIIHRKKFVNLSNHFRIQTQTEKKGAGDQTGDSKIKPRKEAQLETIITRDPCCSKIEDNGYDGRSNTRRNNDWRNIWTKEVHRQRTLKLISTKNANNFSREQQFETTYRSDERVELNEAIQVTNENRKTLPSLQTKTIKYKK